VYYVLVNKVQVPLLYTFPLLIIVL